MEMSRYMLYANTTYMDKKKKEVAVMINAMVRLMDATSLTQEHIDLITKTISWLQNIKPVFRKNSLVSFLQHLCNSSFGITGFLDFVQHLLFLSKIH